MNIAVTSYTGRAAEPRAERTSWYTLLFITAVLFAIEHNVFSSVDVSMSDIGAAADKANLVAHGNLTRRIGYLAFGLYGVVAWLRLPRFRLSVRGLVAVMVLTYIGWAVLSLTWSVSPMLTFRRLSVLGLMAIGITGLLRQFSGKGIVRLVFFATLSYLVIGVGAELALGVFTPWSSGYRFGGTLHPNLQGINCAALVFSALTLIASSKRFRPVLLAVALGGFGFLVLTDSRTALASCMAGLSAVWILKTRPSLVVMTLSLLSCVGLLSILLVVSGLFPAPPEFFLVERTQGGGVLTGRVDLWSILIEYARERPILGYGYGAFFDPERGLDMAARIGTWAFGGPHSIYLGTLLDIGAIGLACLLGVLIGGVLRTVRVYRQSFEMHYLFFTALLVFQIVGGVTEATMLMPKFIPGLTVAFLAFRARGMNTVSAGGCHA